MSLQKKRINNVVVKAAPKWGGDDQRPPRGEKLFKTPFFSAFLSAKKRSGKTSNIFLILSKIISKQTKLIVFCSTVHNDASWVFMIKYFKEKGIDVTTHTSIWEGKENVLQTLLYQIEEEAKADADDDEEEEEPEPKEILKHRGAGVMASILQHNMPPEMNGEGEKEKAPRKSKYQERKYIVVLDDLSTELKTPVLVGLLKNSRHYQMVVLASSQYYLDLKPESRLQLDYFLLYKGQTEEKLEAIYKDANLSIDEEEFQRLYHDATQEPYNFLYVDARRDQFRKNYNEEYEI